MPSSGERFKRGKTDLRKITIFSDLSQIESHNCKKMMGFHVQIHNTIQFFVCGAVKYPESLVENETL